MGLGPTSFNPYKSFGPNAQIQKQAFGVSIEKMNEMIEKYEDSGFVIASEIQRNGSLYWRQMVFVGRKSKISE